MSFRPPDGQEAAQIHLGVGVLVAALGDVWFSLYLVGVVVSLQKHFENNMFCLLPEGSRGALQVCSQELKGTEVQREFGVGLEFTSTITSESIQQQTP